MCYYLVLPLIPPSHQALPVLSSAGVCVLFTRSELAEALKAFKQQFAREASQEGTEVSGTADDTLPLAASAALVAACFVGPSAWVWPAQNVVNSCLAVIALAFHPSPSPHQSRPVDGSTETMFEVAVNPHV